VSPSDSLLQGGGTHSHDFCGVDRGVAEKKKKQKDGCYSIPLQEGPAKKSNMSTNERELRGANGLAEMERR